MSLLYSTRSTQYVAVRGQLRVVDKLELIYEYEPYIQVIILPQPPFREGELLATTSLKVHKTLLIEVMMCKNGE
jgi:hypothetical protein